MAYQAYLTIKGAKQGQFKGSSAQRHKDKWIPILSFNYSIVSPRDSASGQASGKRQWKPIVITKEIGASSHQIFQAFVTNEGLTSVIIEFINTDSTGSEHVHHTIKLTNAAIAGVRKIIHKGPERKQWEEITLAYDALEYNGVTAVAPAHLVTKGETGKTAEAG